MEKSAASEPSTPAGSTSGEAVTDERHAARGPLGLYLHIPFCDSICNYCNFNRGLREPDLERRYLKALETEIARAGDGSPVDSIFFGGGTPSVLSPDDVASLLTVCRSVFDCHADTEVSFEVNPETVTPARGAGWLAAGVTRFSLGMQSLRDEELTRLGRRHTAARAKQAVAELRAAGCANLSGDVMLWLPAQTRAQCRMTVDALLGLELDHASLYLLELYPNAPLREDMARAGWSMAPDDDAAEMYMDALDALEASGYQQYEISNVARSARRCRHNLKYWQDGEWLGFGCGAHSTRHGARWRNISDTARYIDRVNAGCSTRAEHHVLSTEERIGDMLFTGLRLTDGLALTAIRATYGIDVMTRYGEALAPFVEARLVVHAAGRLRLSRAGMLLANEVMKIFV